MKRRGPRDQVLGDLQRQACPALAALWRGNLAAAGIDLPDDKELDCLYLVELTRSREFCALQIFVGQRRQLVLVGTADLASVRVQLGQVHLDILHPELCRSALDGLRLRLPHIARRSPGG